MDKKNYNGHLSEQTENNVMDRVLMDKIQKLTGALYRVTELYPDKEPLKWTLRDDAVYIYTNLTALILLRVSDSVEMSDRQEVSDMIEMSDSNCSYEKVMNVLYKIIHALELASLGGFISDINFEILKKEYSLLKQLIEGGKESFLPERKLLVGTEADLIMETQENNTLKNNSLKKDNNFAIKKKEKGQIKDYTPRNISSEELSERRLMILDFIKKNGKKTISEIALICNGVSEKTIQRDLFGMVKTGELMAEGEKRWRVYSFISH